MTQPSDSTATTHAEILEEEKRKIDNEVSALRAIQENYEPTNLQYQMADILIDELLLKKDNLSADVPSGWLEAAEEEAAESKADAAERAELYEIGMGR